MAMSLLALSCSRVELENPEGTTIGSDLAIKLGVKSGDAIQTRAANKATGDSLYAANENKIYTLDYFLYRKDPSQNADETAFLKGRLTFNGVEPVTMAIAEANTQVIDLKDYYSDESEDKTVYVFVLANLPEEFSWSEDGELLSGETVMGTKWADLQAIQLATDFKKTLSSGKFKPQDSFVMYGLTSKVLSGKGADKVIVDLSRVASKISLDMNIIKLIDKYDFNTVLGVNEYQGSYLPNVDAIQVYLSYVDSTGVLNGTPRTYDNHFFTYNRYAFIPTVTESSFKVSVLARDEEGAIIVDADGNPTYEEGAEFPAFGVKGSPFYSYPISWEASDTHAPFIKIIIPWVKYTVPAAVRNDYKIENSQTHTIEFDPTKQSYKDVIAAVMNSNFAATATMTFDGETQTLARQTTQASMTSRSGDEFYYKISIPSKDYKLESNHWYMIKLDISVLGSESDDASVNISGSKMGIYVLDWSTPNDDLGGDLDGGRYLSTAQNEYTINAVNSITIPVISSHTLKADVVEEKAWVGGEWVDSWTSSTGTHDVEGRGSVTASGTSSVTFTNSLNTTVNGDLDCYKFKFVIRIYQQNSDGSTTGTLEKLVTVYQNPSIYVDEYAGDYAFVNGYYGHLFVNGGTTAYYRGTSGHGTSGNTGNVAVGYGNMTQNTTGQTNMTVVSISSLAEGSNKYTITGSGSYNGEFNYLITDPRTDKISASSLNDYNTIYTNNGDNVTEDWPNVDIKVGSHATSAPGRNFIAPKFMISSVWGRNPGMNSDTAVAGFAEERCATYQEAGYPAGRWRLPTEAEVSFVATLQGYSFISTLFNANVAYAISNGTGIEVNGTSREISTNRRSLRCVYDLWYWGDKPYTETHTGVNKWEYIIAPGDTKLN